MDPHSSDSEQLAEQAEGVRRLARTLVADRTRADDVAQEALLTGLQRPPRAGWTWKTWLSGVVRRKASEERRSERRRQAREHAQPARDVPSPADLAAQVETHKRVLDTLMLLPEPYRTVLWMRFFQDRSPRAIARLMEVPHETVRTHLRRGIDRMRAALDERDAGQLRPWRVALVPLIGYGGNRLGDLITGGLVMTVQTKTGLAIAGTAVLLVASYAAGWWPDLGRREEARTGPELTAASNRAIDDGPALAGRKELAATSSAEPLPPPVDFSKVDRERDLHGVVVQTDGTPVPGAALEALLVPWQNNGLFSLNREDVSVGTTRSASDGTFALRLAPGACVDLTVSAGGFANRRLAQVNAGERVRVALDGGVDLIVSLKDEAGQPVAGCPARIFRYGYGNGDLDVRRNAESDAGGDLVFRRLPGGLLVVLEAKPRTLGDTGWTQITLPPSGVHRQALVVPRGRTIEGVVSDAATGKPIVGAGVGSGWTGAFAVLTDAAGRYRFEGWTGNGRSELAVYADGYVPMLETVGDLGHLDFALSRGIRVQGRVVGPEGGPIEKAVVAGQGRPTREQRPQHSSFPNGRSDASGGFVLEGVQTDRDFALAIQFAGLATYSQLLGKDRLAEALATGTLDLGAVRLEPERWLRGTVTTADGTPVPRVTIYVSGERPERPPTGRWDSEGFRYGVGAQRFTDDLGRFVVRGLSPGNYRVIARPKDQDEVHANVRVPEEGDTPLVRLVLPQVRLLDVEVVTTDGRPVAKFGVSTQGGNLPVGATTDAEGRARLRLTSDVRYVALSFDAQQIDRYLGGGSVELRPDQTRVRFTLHECVPAGGRVVDEQGKGVPLINVRVLGADGAEIGWPRRTDAEGQFRAPIPVGSVVTLSVDGSGQREVASGAFQGVDFGVEGQLQAVQPGEKDLVIRVAKRMTERRLKVYVALPDGSPAAGANVNVRFPAGGGPYAIANEAGEAVIEGLPDRPVTVEVTPNPIGPRGHKLVAITVKNVQHGSDPLRVALREGVFVQGRLVNEKGEGVPNVEVNIRAGDAWVPGTRRRTDERGGFLLLLDPVAFPVIDLDATMTTPEGLLLTAVLKGLRVEETTIELKFQRAR